MRIEKKPTQYILLVIPFIIAFLFSWYWLNRETRPSFKDGKTIGKGEFPAGTVYEMTEEGDFILELKQRWKVFGGSWNKGTRFYFDTNRIEKIEAKDDFSYGEFEFDFPSLIEFDFQKDLYTRIKMNKDMVLDGLDLNHQCFIYFKNNVLFQADCPKFGRVTFKRFLNLPEVKKKK